MNFTFELNVHIPILVWKYLYFIIYCFLYLFFLFTWYFLSSLL
jgi:hypothetical protein